MKQHGISKQQLKQSYTGVDPVLPITEAYNTCSQVHYTLNLAYKKLRNCMKLYKALHNLKMKLYWIHVVMSVLLVRVVVKLIAHYTTLTHTVMMTP